MVDQADKLVKPGGTIVVILLTILFYAFMTKVLMGHVPAQTFKLQLIFGAFAAVPVTGGFWLALELFRVTFVDQLRRKRAQSKVR